MSLRPILIVYSPRGEVLGSSVVIGEGLSGSYITEYTHRVYTIQKDYYYFLMYGVDFVRKHEPIRFVKEIDRLSVLFLEYLRKGEFLPKVEFRWYRYNEKRGREEEYFRITVEKVRLNRMRHIMPDVKSKEWEKYGHLEEVELMFKRISWLYVKGYLIYTDEWKGGFFEEEDEGSGESLETDGNATNETEVVPLRIRFTEGEFEKDGVGFDKRVKVRFRAEFSRNASYVERKVYCKLYRVYKGKVDYIMEEGHLSESGEWKREFLLRKPEGYVEGEEVEYYAEIENSFADEKFRSKSIVLPLNSKIYDIYFTDNNGNKISKVKKNERVYLIIKSRDMEGEKIDIDLSDSEIEFECKDKVMDGGILRELEITGEEIKIELLAKGRERKKRDA